MSNWCVTQYVVEGPINSLILLKDTIEHSSILSNRSIMSQANTLKLLSIKIDNDEVEIDDVVGIIMHKPVLSFEKKRLCFTSEEKWCRTPFAEILKENFDKRLKIYYQTIEPSFFIFETNDADKKYFKQEIYAEGYNSKSDKYYTEYFDSLEEFFEWLDITFKLKSWEEINDFNAQSEKNKSSDFIDVAKFELIGTSLIS